MNEGLKGLPDAPISQNAWRVDKAGNTTQFGGITGNDTLVLGLSNPSSSTIGRYGKLFIDSAGNLVVRGENTQSRLYFGTCGVTNLILENQSTNSINYLGPVTTWSTNLGAFAGTFNSFFGNSFIRTGNFLLANQLSGQTMDNLKVGTITSATVNSPNQYSPALNFSGNSWDGNINTGSAMQWRVYESVFSGTPPTSKLNFEAGISGNYINVVNFDNLGNLSLSGSPNSSLISAGNLNLISNNTNTGLILNTTALTIYENTIITGQVIVGSGVVSDSLFSNNNLVLGTQSFTGSPSTGTWVTGIQISGTQTSLYNTVNMGVFSFQTNPGPVTFIECPIASGSGISGVEQSYSLNIGGQSLLKIYAEFDGSSGIQNTRIILGTGGGDRVYVNAGSNAPAVNSGAYSLPVTQAVYGAPNSFLGTPSGWWEILVSGRVARLPYFFT